MGLFDFKKLKDKFKERKKQKQIKEKVDENKIFKEENAKEKFDTGLRKSSKGLSALVDNIVSQHSEINDELFESLEEQLIAYDVGYNATMKIVDAVKEEVKFQNVNDINSIMQIMLDKLLVYYIQDSTIDTDINLENNRTNVVLVSGVNGVGKTTSIAKIANKFVKENKKVLLVAGDTFRAGAVEQLKK